MEVKMKNPALRLWVGPMFGSKTTQLIAAVDRYRLQSKKVLAFKSRLDDRYSSEGEIVTHNGGKLACSLVGKGEEIIDIVKNHIDDVSVVAIDEAFMIENCDDAILRLYNSGFSVLVSSIDLSSDLRPFSVIKNILPFATEVNTCTAVCTACGEDAKFTFKKSTITGSEIEIGGSEIYEPRCWMHHDKTREEL
jgi:thymidine kinase